MIPLTIFAQTVFLAVFAALDAIRRRVDNLPIVFLAAAGLINQLLDPTWNAWNVAPATVALIAYRYKQIGGADAKTLIALTTMPGPWIPWFLGLSVLCLVPLHLLLKRPPVMVAFFMAILVLVLGHFSGLSY